MSVNLLTDWRVALAEVLEEAFPQADIASELWPGQRSGFSRDRDRIRLVVGPMVPVAGDVNNTNPTLLLRYWLAFPKVGPLLADVPTDPAPIEQLMVDMAAVLEANLTGLGAMDYFHAGPITPDGEEYGIEVTLTAWTRNPAETGG